MLFHVDNTFNKGALTNSHYHRIHIHKWKGYFSCQEGRYMWVFMVSKTLLAKPTINHMMQHISRVDKTETNQMSKVIGTNGAERNCIWYLRNSNTSNKWVPSHTHRHISINHGMINKWKKITVWLWRQWRAMESFIFV